MSTISSSTTSTTAYKVTADTTGTLVIQTGATPTTAVTVDTSQNVGIGTSSPAYKLDVSATSFIAASVSTSYSGAGNIRIADASTTSGSAPYIGSVGNNLTFGRIGTAEYMRIDSSGNVGIGTSSPSTYGKLAATGTSAFGVDQTDYINALGGGGTARVEAVGGNTNINLALSTKGTGAFYIWRGGYGGTNTLLIDGSSNLQFNSGYGSVATAYGCRAWVNFDGVTTATIRASGNVTSVTRNSAGDYTINFTNAMPDVNYCVTSSNKYDNANTSFANGVTVVARYTTAYQTGSVRVQTGISAATDTVAVCVAIFR